MSLSSRIKAGELCSWCGKSIGKVFHVTGAFICSECKIEADRKFDEMMKELFPAYVSPEEESKPVAVNSGLGQWF